MKKKTTLAQLEATAENWYQRTRRLREVWQDETETQERRDKAGRLWFVMYFRVVDISSAISEAHLKRSSAIVAKFPPGGIVTPQKRTP